MQSGYLAGALIAAAIGRVGWLYFRTGTFTGAMLGGVVKREEGQVSAKSYMGSSQRIKVCAMESLDGESYVGISLMSNTHFMPIKLSKTMAEELSRLLQKASV